MANIGPSDELNPVQCVKSPKMFARLKTESARLERVAGVLFSVICGFRTKNSKNTGSKLAEFVSRLIVCSKRGIERR